MNTLQAITLALSLFSAAGHAASGGRIDPHGSASSGVSLAMVAEQKECLFCHGLEGGRLSTKPTTQETCMNCHNQAPHSGVAEHKPHKISCISCHSPHRANGKLGQPASGVFSQLQTLPQDERFKVQSRPNAMLIKTCTDCHRW